ncbi:MAG: CehA/McbA family metallohydrolase [Gemmataceae bacterium]
MLTVHVRVNDQATGQPTPVRLRITAGEGIYHAPLGRLTHFATGKFEDVGGNLLLGMKAYAYIDGSCEIKLPAGPLHVDICKGPEYRPVSQDIELGVGKIALRFNVERWANMREAGWFSGDARAHALTPHAALLEGQAEDLAVVNLLACETQVGFTQQSNILAFSGQRPALEAAGCIVAVNTHNRHPELGSLGLLHAHRVVFPLAFGGRGRPDDWTLADWCDQCHRKRGLVVWTDTAHESEHFRLGEPLADLLLGKVDAFEVTYFEDSPYDVLPDWYRLLNVGLRVPLVGASGKERNFTTLGSMRTYAKAAADTHLDFQGWIEAIRAGQTFISNGPLLELKVNGQDPGAVIDIAANRPVRIEATARSLLPFERLEVIGPQGTVATASVAGTDPVAAKIDMEWQPAATGWLAARCTGPARLPGYPAPQTVFAHSSPVYVNVGGVPFAVQEEARRQLAKSLDDMLHWAKTVARCPSERERQAFVDVFQQARARLAEL